MSTCLYFLNVPDLFLIIISTLICSISKYASSCFSHRILQNYHVLNHRKIQITSQGSFNGSLKVLSNSRIDSCTSYAWIFILRSKTEVNNHFKIFRQFRDFITVLFRFISCINFLRSCAIRVPHNKPEISCNTAFTEDAVRFGVMSAPLL